VLFFHLSGKSTLINSLAASAASRLRRLQQRFGPSAGEVAPKAVGVLPYSPTNKNDPRRAGRRGRGGLLYAKQLAKVGDFPGVTRSVNTIQISDLPSVRILDTPGIMIPKVGSTEMGLRLAITGAIADEVAERK
jgi:ribosome biogenesis GTPase A